MRFSKISVFVFCFLALGCQSSPHVAFEKISLGATKGEVLSQIGSPDRTYQKGGNVYWVYKMRTRSGNWMTKELVLKNNVVVEKTIPTTNKPAPADYEEL